MKLLLSSVYLKWIHGGFVWAWKLKTAWGQWYFLNYFQTASLPGRIDGIDQLLRPESPIVRPISPISILRDSRPMSPLAFNSSHTSPVPSPSPSPSPEHPLPSTPPIRLEDFSPVKSEDDTGIHSGSSETDHEVSGVQVWGRVGRDIVSMFRRETCCSYFCIGHILSPSGMTDHVYKLEIFFHLSTSFEDTN